jgi:hypothetical protein
VSALPNLNTLILALQTNVAGVDLRRKPPLVLHPPILGSPCKALAPVVLEALNQGNPIFRQFERRLLRFLKPYAPNENGDSLGGDGKVLYSI